MSVSIESLAIIHFDIIVLKMDLYEGMDIIVGKSYVKPFELLLRQVFDSFNHIISHKEKSLLIANLAQ